MFAMWYFVSLYLQQVLGYSPIKAGLAFLPMTITHRRRLDARRLDRPPLRHPRHAAHRLPARRRRARAVQPHPCGRRLPERRPRAVGAGVARDGALHGAADDDRRRRRRAPRGRARLGTRQRLAALRRSARPRPARRDRRLAHERAARPRATSVAAATADGFARAFLVGSGLRVRRRRSSCCRSSGGRDRSIRSPSSPTSRRSDRGFSRSAEGKRPHAHLPAPPGLARPRLRRLLRVHPEGGRRSSRSCSCWSACSAATRCAAPPDASRASRPRRRCRQLRR